MQYFTLLSSCTKKKGNSNVKRSTWAAEFKYYFLFQFVNNLKPYKIK